MTWDHPRGYDPLVAASAEWRARGGPEIAWDRRSLQDFESYPVEELARRYDLIVIDHPHVGQLAQHGCIAPIDTLVVPAELADIAARSIGGSYESYAWQGRQWALPIDAAAQVQAWVPGRLAAPLTRWSELAPLVAQRRVLLPLRPPHSLMALFTLSGMFGVALDIAGPDLFPAAAAAPLAALAELADALDPACFDMDPIAVLEAMAAPDAAIAVAPLIYGYVSYAVQGFRPTRIGFADLPAAGPAGPRGSVLGGTGIAVSALAADPEAAACFAVWVAGAEVQQGLYAAKGGQPAHACAWEAEAVNTPIADFCRATRATLDRAWLRPRHHGYMAFQAIASERLNHGLCAREAPAAILAALNALYRDSL
ncbi:carbohydrate ABC transporter substrate-binding protein [Sphingomonas sp. DG1-23]|uniref:extracellular solute-binding protein n=1 Tax=Sphingomonas sp. DG1-23 TaxID=3068316 RepID=UPI00273DAEA4|nr:extracellular solute-binding protein [Sphingomonas sp. DG1-23]MDP5279815.1 carbohydrate ABC transporter substrate-binding protein [Sphingomonas sp. DG1-23]